MPESASTHGHSVFRFGVFEFHAGSLDLTRQGTSIRLQTQPARLLRLLLLRAGELITRDEIYRSLWDDGTTVDFEMAVNRCIRQLREALGDDIDAPRYIKTVPRFGYCFIAAAIGTDPVNTLEKPVAPEVSSVQQGVPQPSIVVLPFANLSGDPSDEYFSDGLTEEITNVLTQIPGLKVIARTSAFAFKGKNVDVRTIARTLEVGNVLEGSVRRSGSRVRVAVQLIQASDGSHCLSKRYEQELKDVFALEDEISADVAQELRFHLGVARRPTEHVAAYEAYLEGRFHWGTFTLPAFQKGLQCFERAITIDPGYAAAHTGVARCLAGLAKEGGAPALECLPKAAAVARRALELDASEGEAHSVLGEVAAMLDYDWPAAAEHFQTALKLNPSTYVRGSYALWYLIPQGRAAEALAQSDAALARDPLNVTGHLLRAVVSFFVGNNEAGAEGCLRALELNETFPRAILTLSLIRSYQGRFEEGIRWAERLIQIFGRTHMSLMTLGMVLAEAGRSEAARSVLAELENLPFARERFPTGVGLIYAGLNDEESTFRWFQQAVESRDPTILRIRMLRKADRPQLNVIPQEILRRMNLLKPIEECKPAATPDRSSLLPERSPKLNDEARNVENVVRQAPLDPNHIVGRKQGRCILLRPSEIFYFSAESGLVKAHTASDSYQVEMTLSDLEEALVKQRFFRAHRSFLVNLWRVKEIEPYFRGTYVLIMNDVTRSQLQVSERQAKLLREQIPGL